MPKNQQMYNEGSPFIVTHKVASITILAVIILVGTFIGWWGSVYNSPKRVFIGMLNNSLSTPSVTREVTSSSDGQTAHQHIQLSFVGQPTSHSIVDVTQSVSGVNSSVQTETIGTSSTDYSRYLKLVTNQKNAAGKPINFSSVVGVWGTTGQAPAGQPTSATYLQQSIVGLVPFANLNPTQRASVVNQLLADRVYTVDYSKAKAVKIGSHAAWQYDVSFNTASYLKVFKNLSTDLGLGSQPDIDPSAYAKSPPLSVGLTVDKASRELLRLTYQDGQQQENYTSYGITTPVTTPSKTIPINELQTRLANVH